MRPPCRTSCADRAPRWHRCRGRETDGQIGAFGATRGNAQAARRLASHPVPTRRVELQLNLKLQSQDEIYRGCSFLTRSPGPVTETTHGSARRRDPFPSASCSGRGAACREIIHGCLAACSTLPEICWDGARNASRRRLASARRYSMPSRWAETPSQPRQCCRSWPRSSVRGCAFWLPPTALAMECAMPPQEDPMKQGLHLSVRSSYPVAARARRNGLRHGSWT